MLFRRRSRSHDAPVVQILGDCSVQLTPIKDVQVHKPHTLRETYILPTKPLSTLHYRGGSSDDNSRSSNSSPDQSPKAPKRSPTSRKTGYATIHTDSTDTQPAFESDAFAVLMPTTRLPILESPISPTKNASPAARADALRTYQEKARQIRERNNSEGVQVPSRLASYDYGARRLADTDNSNDIDSKIPTPAGSYPISPPLVQNTWTCQERAAADKAEEVRHVRQPSKISTPTKPIAVKTSTATSTSTTSSYRVYRPDSKAGASRSPSSASPLPPTITVRIKPRGKNRTQDAERLQAESTPQAYTRPNYAPSIHSKSMSTFTRHKSVEGDSIFGYKRKDTISAIVGESPTSSGHDKKPDESKSKTKPEKKTLTPKSTETTPKCPLTSRFPWLRSQSPRIAKPTTTPVTFAKPPSSPTTLAAPRPTSKYIDPFIRLATPQPETQPSLPAPLRTPSSSPKITPRLSKLTTTPYPHSPSTSPTTPKSDSGFAQIKSFSWILVRVCAILYAVVALWFVLDALREAAYMLGVPFRIGKWLAGWVCVWGKWVVRVGGAVVGIRI